LSAKICRSIVRNAILCSRLACSNDSPTPKEERKISRFSARARMAGINAAMARLAICERSEFPAPSADRTASFPGHRVFERPAVGRIADRDGESRVNGRESSWIADQRSHLISGVERLIEEVAPGRTGRTEDQQSHRIPSCRSAARMSSAE
jgi:hypothetical protein